MVIVAQASGKLALGGPVALVGGAEFNPPAASLDAWLLERSGTPLVTVLATAAREHPGMAVSSARRHFALLGGQVQEAPVRTRADAEQPGVRAQLATARFIYLTGGDPRYLAAVLQDSPAWAGVLDALGAGAVLAGSSAGAMVLCQRMHVPGASSTTAGLGLINGIIVLAHHNRAPARPQQLSALVASSEASAGALRMLGIDEATGLVVDGPACHVLGAGSVTLYRPGSPHPEVVWTAQAPARLDQCL